MIEQYNTTTPLSYLEWKSHYEDSYDSSDLPVLYNNYLADWKEEKVTRTTVTADYTKTIYKQFLKNINLSTLSSDIHIFLNRLDTDNIYELELAVHYYSNIIKDQLKNICSIREELQFTKTKNKLKSSRKGITSYLKNFILKLLSNKEFVTEGTDTHITDISIERIANNIQINLDTYVADSFVYSDNKVNKNLILNMNTRVIEEMYNITQVLSINKDNKPLKIRINNTSSPNSIVGINQPFTNWERLPVRYFKDETKTIENLKFIFERGLIEKYLSNDLYYLESKNKTLIKLFEHENTTNNLSQRYKPNLFVQLTDIKNKQVFPQQLCFYNAGITPFYSSNLTFTINMSALNGQNYIIPDPSKFQPGVTTTGFVKDSITGEIIKNLTSKRKVPITFSNKTAHFKNTNVGTSTNIYNNKILRNYGYQSKENSIDYSHTGINRKEDNISFWDNDKTHVVWQNTDTYPIEGLNIYPESSRLEDLLITNKTGIKLKSDIYGNEFLFIKSVYPKRLAGIDYIPAPESTASACITSAEYYDGLFFNPLLSALSAAYYETHNTLLDGITAIYDTFVYNDTPSCDNGSAELFSAPLTDYSCDTLFTDALSCGSVSATSAIDCGSFLNHPGDSTDLLMAYFQETTVPYFTIDTTAIYSNRSTSYESTTLNNFATSAVHLFEQQYVSAGEIYVRNAGTQLVSPLSAAFSDIFNKHTNSTKSNILTSSNILDFDIIENTIYIQTSAETITEKYKFKKNKFKIDASSKTIII